MIIDCHGHYTTAPKALEDWRNRQIAGIQDPSAKPRGVRAEDQRRRAARVDREQPAAPDEGARQRPHDLQPARQLHGASHRRLRGRPRPGPPSATSCAIACQPALPRPFHRRGHAAAVAGRRSAHLHPGAGALRPGLRLRRHQPQPRSLRRPLDQPAAVRPPLVPALREDGGARHPGHGAREHQLQRLLPHHRRALPERRHHRLHAVPDLATCSRTSRRCASSSRTAAARCPTTGGASAAWRRS